MKESGEEGDTERRRERRKEEERESVWEREREGRVGVVPRMHKMTRSPGSVLEDERS